MPLYIRLSKDEMMIYTKGIGEDDLTYQRFHNAIMNQNVVLEIKSYFTLPPNQQENWWVRPVN